MKKIEIVRIEDERDFYKAPYVLDGKLVEPSKHDVMTYKFTVELDAARRVPEPPQGDGKEPEWRIKAIKWATKNLTDRELWVFVNCFLGGMPERQAAESMGISIRRVQYLREQIRKKLAKAAA